jgi:hypothetical protein
MVVPRSGFESKDQAILKTRRINLFFGAEFGKMRPLQHASLACRDTKWLVVHANVESVEPGGPTEVERADSDAADPTALIWPVA